MPLSKQALLVENNTNFPNNNFGYITPALLREFNADMIDAMQLTQSMSEYAVLSGSNAFIGNQTITGNLNVSGVISASILHVQYETASVIFSTGSNQLGDELTDIQTLSGSVKIQGQLLINGVPLTSGSTTDTGSLVTTASFNAYTSSNNQRVTALETNSASVNISIANINTTTASLNTSITNLNAFSASQKGLNGTFATTGSNTFTGNQVIDRANKLYTNGIYWTDVTAGFNNLEIINQGGGNLDFASLNGGKMRIVSTPLILTGSALSSSNDISTSANVYGANLTASAIPVGTISSSAQISALGFVSSSVTASSLITASFSGNTLTFTKGDSSTFGVVIPDVSGSTIPAGTVSSSAQIVNYGIFATTGSNQFIGNQAIDGTLTITGKIIGSQSIILQPNANDARTLEIYNTSPADTHITASGGELFLGNDETYVLVNTNANQKLVVIRGDEKIVASGSLDISGSLTSSLQQGYVLVGDSNNRTKLVATSSFGGGGTTNTGSLMVTGSISGNTLTFTKGDASTFDIIIPSASGSIFDTGSFATTGSNTFNGDQSITGSLSVFLPKSSGKEFRVSWGDASSASMFTETNAGPSQTLTIVSASIDLKRGGISFDSGSIVNSGDQIQFNAFPSASFVLRTQNGGTAEIRANTDYTDANRPNAFVRAYYNGDIQLTGFGGGITISGSGTSIQGVDFIPFSSSVDTRVKASLVTGSVAGNVLTFTKGDATTFSLTVATGSGGGGGATYENPTLNPYSGSLILVANTFTSSSFAHISASANGQVNLAFKNNNNTGDTILSGSNNIFTNQTAPNAGFKRYIGGNGNILLGLATVPQISGSMAFSPTFPNNYIAGTMIMRGPVSSSAWTIQGNNIQGILNIGNSAALNAEKLTSGLTLTSNDIVGTLTIVANQSALTGSTTSFSNNIIAGTTTLNLSSSVVQGSNNIINDSAFTFTNQYYSSSLGLGNVAFNRNNIGGQSNSIIISGSLPAGGAQSNSISDNFIFGGTNTIYIDVANARVSGSAVYKNVIRTGLMGNNLIVSGSSLLSDGSSYGSVFVGRYNANDNIRNRTSNTVFAVGTGNTTTRKTGFLIDSGSNTFVEGTLNVSGSTFHTGSIYIQSGSWIPSATGSSLLTWDAATGQIGQSSVATLISSSFSVGAFNSTITQSGSSNVSQSMTFNNTDISNGVSIVSNSQITLANNGTYNIQFSAQVLAGTGADTIWIWLKKNGTNVSNTATKLVLANNEANVAAWNFVVPAVATDYFELVWQNLNGHATLLTEVASGNYPAIPSIIVTVTQVE